MKFLSTWLRNVSRLPPLRQEQRPVLNEVPEHMAQEYAKTGETLDSNVDPQ